MIIFDFKYFLYLISHFNIIDIFYDKHHFYSNFNVIPFISLPKIIFYSELILKLCYFLISWPIINLWQFLCRLLPFLDLINSFFTFLYQILILLKDVLSTIIGYLQEGIKYITNLEAPSANDSWWDAIVKVVKLTFSFIVGGVVIYFFKEIVAFLLGFVVKMIDISASIVIRIFDIIKFYAKTINKVYNKVPKKYIIKLSAFYYFIIKSAFIPSKYLGAAIICKPKQVNYEYDGTIKDITAYWSNK